MFEIIMLVLAIFLSIIGLCELMHRLWMVLIRPKKTENMLLIILNDELAVEQITAALEELRWQGSNFATTLVGIDMGLSTEISDTCKKISKDNQDFIFTTTEELGEFLKQRS